MEVCLSSVIYTKLHFMQIRISIPSVRPLKILTDPRRIKYVLAPFDPTSIIFDNKQEAKCQETE